MTKDEQFMQEAITEALKAEQIGKCRLVRSLLLMIKS